jgi:glutathione S-transferase
VLYGHPFSSYTQKVLIALYENATPFEFRVLGPDAPQHAAQWLAKWPLRQFPLLVDGARDVVETSIIIEYLQPRACLRSFRGRASTLPGWDARRGARLIARLSTSAATPQTARQGSCPRVGAKSGDWTPRLLAWA